MSTIETMTIKELVAQHDAIQGVEPITKWNGRKDLLVEKVAAAMKAARGNKTIREVAEALLIEVASNEDGKPIGHPYDYVLDKVLAEFPEANTTVKCLRWYNTKLNSDPNVKMPVRPRKKAVKHTGLESCEAEVETTQVEEPAKEMAEDPLA
jgi:hypothetical protein